MEKIKLFFERNPFYNNESGAKETAQELLDAELIAVSEVYSIWDDLRHGWTFYKRTIKYIVLLGEFSGRTFQVTYTADDADVRSKHEKKRSYKNIAKLLGYKVKWCIVSFTMLDSE